jgi:hypothetical protein
MLYSLSQKGGKGLDGSKLLKELCFVWGAPLSGQRRWMFRSAELSRPETDVSLCFSGPDTTLEVLCRSIESEMEKLTAGENVKPQHIYVELPPRLLYEDFELEEWLQTKRDWSLSFAGVISEQAHKLNEHYRSLYEEFSRSTHSAVVLGRSAELREDLPFWIQNKEIDFGKRVEVYEDDLWPKSLLRAPDEILNGLAEHEGDFEEIELPILFKDTQKIEILFRQMIQGEFGALWGAELLKLSGALEQGRAEWQAYTLSAQALYQWSSRVRARSTGLSREVSVLSLAGVGIDKTSSCKACEPCNF